MSENLTAPSISEQKYDYEFSNRFIKNVILGRNKMNPNIYNMKSNSAKIIKILSNPLNKTIKNNINTSNHSIDNSKSNITDKISICSNFNNSCNKNKNYSLIIEKFRKKITRHPGIPLILQKNYSKFKNTNFQNLENSENPSLEFNIYKIPRIKNFHKYIMSQNKFIYMKKINKEYNEMKKELDKEGDEYIQNLNEENKNRSTKTGIYGPSNNIISLIRAKMEKLKIDNQYKWASFDVKDIIKDEIMDAQVKFKRKPKKLSIKNYQEMRPAFSRKLDNLRYLSHMNKIRAINQKLNVPILIKDGNTMSKLVNDAIDIFNVKKYSSLEIRNKSM